MKHYYVNYHRDFANMYTIGACEANSEADKMAAQSDEWDRITRKEAEEYCRRERRRRREDQNFSGYASAEIGELVYDYGEYGDPAYGDEKYLHAE